MNGLARKMDRFVCIPEYPEKKGGMGMKTIFVACDGSAMFRDIQSAVDAAPEDGAELRIKEGVYRQKVVVEKPGIRMIGEGNVTIVWDDAGRKLLPDQTPMGTFNSYTFFVGARDFYAENITFENDAGCGKKVGQALAAYVDADRVCFRNCRFLGWQDTLFTGPLPPAEIIPGGFKGPRQFAPRINGRQYYENCYFRGDIDFIFGSATAYFSKCEFESNDLGEKINGFVTAPSTAEGQEYGYVFSDCRFTGSCAPESVYLFRPWRNFAKAVFLHCFLGAHICKEGVDNWNKPESESTVYCAEFENYGEGTEGTKRPSWVHTLTKQEAAHFSKEKVLAGKDGWNP